MNDVQSVVVAASDLQRYVNAHFIAVVILTDKSMSKIPLSFIDFSVLLEKYKELFWVWTQT